MDLGLTGAGRRAGRHLAVKRLPLPDYAGSDSFVPWPAPA